MSEEERASPGTNVLERTFIACTKLLARLGAGVLGASLLQA